MLGYLVHKWGTGYQRDGKRGRPGNETAEGLVTGISGLIPGIILKRPTLGTVTR